ncbi:hypothetical protein TNCT_504291 [Trichonephila clavata]|uniref:Uncharacterized protein n=1 Tax=Trichonephila clavata TaxID=2740835 RepID=A0A8X6LMD0_TRICU|nr:hypothetical protein TNCT_504291 [Trichonephila clavata]
MFCGRELIASVVSVEVTMVTPVLAFNAPFHASVKRYLNAPLRWHQALNYDSREATTATNLGLYDPSITF